MNNSRYEMPNQEFIRSTIESLVGIKVNEISSEKLTQLIIKQNLATDDSGERRVDENFIQIIPDVEVISGSAPSHIEQDTILTLAYALIDKLLIHYAKYHQELPVALVYMSNNNLNSSKIHLYTESDLKSLYYYQAKGDAEHQAKLFIYKLKFDLEGSQSVIH